MHRSLTHKYFGWRPHKIQKIVSSKMNDLFAFEKNQRYKLIKIMKGPWQCASRCFRKIMSLCLN